MIAPFESLHREEQGRGSWYRTARIVGSARATLQTGDWAGSAI